MISLQPSNYGKSHCYSNEGTLESFLNPNYFESWSLITTEISPAVEAFYRNVKKYFANIFHDWFSFCFI